MTTHPLWTLTSPRVNLGMLHRWLSNEDPRKADEQFNTAYPFGGWQPFEGFEAYGNFGLAYPGDPVLYPLAWCELHGERVCLYAASWVAVWSGSEVRTVARMD